MSALLSSSLKWDDLALVKLLDQPYAEALRRVYGYVEPLLGARPLGAEEFTDHDLHHSSRIVQRIGQILPQKGAELNHPELYILLLSALLHDAGMWTTREDADALRADQEFKKYCSRHFERKLDEVGRELSSTGREWLGRLGLQLLAASYNRGKHAERLGTFVFSEGKHAPSPTGQTLRILVGSDFVEAVVAVSVAHSWNHKKVLEDESLRPREFGGNGELVDLRFLAILLRLGDLLDLGEGRISSLMWDYLRPLNPVSEANWRKEHKLKIDRCQADLIQISGHFDIDRGGINEREAYRLANDWLKWLEDEIQFVHHYAHLMEPQLSKRLQLGALRFDKNRVTVKGLAAEGQVSFELDRQRIMRLLGDEIYSDGCIFVRELLQNAVDATRAQMVRDHKRQIENHDPLFPPDKPWQWPHEITERYTITINTGIEKIAEKTYVTFSIADPGVGMSLKQISNYFLQVGISYYKTDEFREEFIFPSISNFGIGFLSCLMVADKIEVLTRPHDEPMGLRLSIQSPSDHFLVEKIEDSASATLGTKVKLWIEPYKLRSECWDSLPINDKNATLPFVLMEPLQSYFAKSIRHWGPFIEFPVSINGKSFWSRLSTKFVLIPKSKFSIDKNSETEVRSIQIKILSHSKDQLADGRIDFFVFKPSGIPILLGGSFGNSEINVSRFIGARGMYLSSATLSNYVISLNFNRLPKNALTAGRQLRKGFFNETIIVNKVAKNFILKVLEQLNSRSKEFAALWQIIFFPLLSEHTLYPCRTAQDFTWVTLKEAIIKYQRIILVPFGIAWLGNWILDVPCLGIPNPDIIDLYFDEKLLFDNHLVGIDGMCTGYLWPSSANGQGLPLVKGTQTFLKNGPVQLHGMKKGGRYRRYKINHPSMNPHKMPEYDRNGNPWDIFGLHNVFGKNLNDIELAAIEHLREAPHMSFENIELEIILDDTEDWE